METKEPNETPLYSEEQRFRQPLPWLIIGIAMLFSFTSVGQVFFAAFSKDAADLPAEYKTKLLTMVGVVLLNIIVLFLFLTAKLSVEVRTNGLFVKFFPFHRKWRPISLEGAVNAEHVCYAPIKDYGGWGIRYGFKKKAYNISGSKGVRINYNNAHHILIGSKNGDQLQSAIESIRS